MFEYLMPLLVMPNYENTLLDRTYHAVVRRQIEYGRQRGVPWGISESGYNTIDQHTNLPISGVRRAWAGAEARPGRRPGDCALRERTGADGRRPRRPAATSNGWRPTASKARTASTKRSITPLRDCRRAPNSVTVRQFMAHHEGMSLLSLAYVLLDKPMQRRFLADPMLRAADLLLQERVPKATAPVFPHASEASATRRASAEEAGSMRVFTDPNSATVEAHLLSNGRYHVAVTSAGGGYSRWRDLAVTRWREDATRDCYGSFCYVRDLDSGALWSNAWQPTVEAHQDATKRSSRKRGPSFAAPTTRSRPTPKSAFRRRTTSNCAA